VSSSKLALRLAEPFSFVPASFTMLAFLEEGQAEGEGAFLVGAERERRLVPQG